MSRNQREGRYVGHFMGLAYRSRSKISALIEACDRWCFYKCTKSKVKGKRVTRFKEDLV